jgi:hypothetical protein
MFRQHKNTLYIGRDEYMEQLRFFFLVTKQGRDRVRMFCCTVNRVENSREPSGKYLPHFYFHIFKLDGNKNEKDKERKQMCHNRSCAYYQWC